MDEEEQVPLVQLNTNPKLTTTLPELKPGERNS